MKRIYIFTIFIIIGVISFGCKKTVNPALNPTANDMPQTTATGTSFTVTITKTATITASSTNQETITTTLTSTETATITSTATATATATGTAIQWVTDNFEDSIISNRWDTDMGASFINYYPLTFSAQICSECGTRALQFKENFVAGMDPNFAFLFYRPLDANKDLSAYNTVSFDASLLIDSGVTGGYFVYLEFSDNSGNYYYGANTVDPFINSYLISRPDSIPWQHYSIPLDANHFVPASGTTPTKTFAQVLEDVFMVIFVVEVHGVPGTVTFNVDNLKFSAE